MTMYHVTQLSLCWAERVGKHSNLRDWHWDKGNRQRNIKQGLVIASCCGVT